MLRSVIKVILITIICVSIFLGFSLIYLKLNSEKENVYKPKNDVPYNSVPENAGILFTLPEDDLLLLYLDFENLSCTLLFPQYGEEIKSRYGKFAVDYNVNISFDLLEGIVDRVGGIEINSMRLTGVQTIEYLSKTSHNSLLKTKISEKIIEQISKNGFSKNDFAYIIENSETNLAVPDCFYWQDYMREICKNSEVIF